MTTTLDAFAVWLRATDVSQAITASPWLWPVCEIAHFVGLSVLVGVVGFFDLRLLGFVPRRADRRRLVADAVGEGRIRAGRTHRRRSSLSARPSST